MALHILALCSPETLRSLRALDAQHLRRKHPGSRVSLLPPQLDLLLAHTGGEQLEQITKTL
ncbi:hypothetical protein STEG23_017214, partial [Scotinomys teguina]